MIMIGEGGGGKLVPVSQCNLSFPQQLMGTWHKGGWVRLGMELANVPYNDMGQDGTPPARVSLTHRSQEL